MTRLSKLILLLIFIPVLCFARGDYYKGVLTIIVPTEVAYWNFENGAFADDSTGSNDLTNSGADEDSTYYKIDSQSASFVRANSDYMTITEANQDAGFPWRNTDGGSEIKNFTVCWWAYWVTLGNNYGMFFSKGKDGDNDAFSANLDTDTNKLNFASLVSDSEEGKAFGTAFQTGRWYFIACAYQNSDKSYRVRIWDDTAGDLLGTDLTGTFTAFPTEIDAAFNLGMRLGGGTPYLFSNAKIDGMKVFDTKLTAAQIDYVRTHY